jgi:hypothetical protein
MSELEGLLESTSTLFKIRFWRDYGRLKAILNKNDESSECFDKAENLIDVKTRDHSIKYMKVRFFRALASKRVSLEKAYNIFGEVVVMFTSLFEADIDYFICQSFLEMGNIETKRKNFEEAQDLYTLSGKFLAENSEDEVFGKFKGENHPLMQQYFLVEIDWASNCSMLEAEVSMLEKYKTLIKSVNQPRDKE